MATVTGPLRPRDSAPPNDANNSSVSGLVSTLIPILLVSGAFTLLFFIFRRTQRRQYAPRSFLTTLREQERSPSLPNGMFNWVGEFFQIPDTYVLNHQSLDGYLLLRFLKIITMICFVGATITIPVLFPVNATGGSGKQGLDMLSFSNVDATHNNNPRFYAHVFIACIFFGFVMYTITRESIYYINLRQAYLLSPLYANRISSRTVLFNSVPDTFLDEAKIRRMYGNKVKNLWIATDCKDITKLVEERDKVAFKLEAAETKLVKLSNNARLKSLKNGGASHEEARENADVNGEPGSAAARWIRPKDRPTHKLKFLIGKKVDTINWCRSELKRLIPLVEAEQAKHRAGEAKFVSSVFVEFFTQADAQAAYQTTAHHLPLHMSPRFIGVNPNEVVWGNLRIKWWERIIRNIVTISFIVVLIIFWAIPVAFVGSLSNIDKVITVAPFLSFINKIPASILGVITKLLPAVLLGVLMALLPIILRLAAKMGGMPSLARIELRTQNFYFMFQVVQVFLVTTLSSSAVATGAQIAKNPSSAPSILAAQIPTVSNFYISYFIVQGLTISSGALLQLVGLILSKFLGRILDSTPRKMYKRWSSLSGLGWGTVFPIYTLLIVIAITYSCIAPLTLAFAAIGLYLLYLANRYNLLFVNNANIDTRGLVYPRALQQITCGVYLAEIVMIGLFGVSVAIGPLVIMVIFTIFTILYHVSLNSALAPLLQTLPLSLDAEQESLLSIEDGNGERFMKNGSHSTSQEGVKELPPAPHKKPNFFAKWLHPEIYQDYHTLKRLVPSNFADIVYSPEVERNAYYNPAVASPTPLLWIPRDSMGVSRQEVTHTSEAIPITDEGAGFDDKGKVFFQQDVPPPIYEEKIYY